MKTPYIPHYFGEEALAKTKSRLGWLTVGVVSSIPWPEDDVWIEYEGAEYLLRGTKNEGSRLLLPCINTPANRDEFDVALSRIYRFVSVLGYFKRGYVDISGYTLGSGPIRYSNLGNSIPTITLGGKRSFSCNHMPIIEDDKVRKALAFLREGRRLRRVHEPYSFLSFFKVIESQFPSKKRVNWINKNLDNLGDRASKRVSELRSAEIDVSKHIYESGRCSVAHASLGEKIIDPDIPADRKRIAEDLVIVEALAERYLKIDAGVPDEMDLFRLRDRIAPWHTYITPQGLATLRAGGHFENPEELGKLEGAEVSVRLWPDPPARQFEEMKLFPVSCENGVVKLIALNPRKTIALAFAMDVAKGRMHILLNESGIRSEVEVVEEDVEDYTRFFFSVLANRIVELNIEGSEPVDCEVVIPSNIIPQAPEEAVAKALEYFRRSKGQEA